jgi:hypothetical protein
MRNRIAAVVLGVALVGAPAAAIAKDENKKGKAGYEEAIDHGLENGDYQPYEKRYLRLYDRFADEFGVEEAGRNVVIFGEETKGGVRDAGRERVEKSSAYFETSLNPPVPAEAAVATETTESSYAGAASGTVMCESGGDYAANTGNGYYGGYQFDSATWDAYGDPAYAEANEAPPAVQDAAAASVPYDAWPNC